MHNSDVRENELRDLAQRLGFEMEQVELFDRALTHASMLGEVEGPAFDYETLEFLGDAVLGLVVAHHLFEHVPDRSPGEYSRMRAGLVNRTCLARVGRQLDIVPTIRLGKGEERAGGRRRDALVADCLEALIGAIYLDSGYDAARVFVEGAFAGELKDAESADLWDYKSRLQNHCQGKGMGLPEFKVIRAEGPDHRKEFEVEVYLQGTVRGSGKGKSKKAAEQAAARQALDREVNT